MRLRRRNLLLFTLIIFGLIPLYNLTKEEYSECLKLSSIYKELNMNCDKIFKKQASGNEIHINDESNNTNINSIDNSEKNDYSTKSFLKPEQYTTPPTEVSSKARDLLLNSYKMYKRNLNELYSIYKNNEDYKGFIKAMDKTLREKASTPNAKDINGKKNFRFAESSNMKNDDVNFDTFFDPNRRKQLTEGFVNSISSDKLRNEIRSQYKNFKESDTKNILKIEQKFFTQEKDYAKTDSKAVELSNRLYGSLRGLADKYKGEKPPGLLTVDGHISNDPVGYIKTEEEKFKSTYKEADNYSYEDIKNLMKLDDIGNEITIMAK